MTSNELYSRYHFFSRTFRNGHKRREFHLRIRLAHFCHDFLEGVERAVLIIYVVLIDLVGQQEQMMFMSKANNVFDVFASQYLASRITGIDHY